MPGRPPCIAITGGIACGKSAFGRMLEERGAEVADADDVVRQLQSPGGSLSRAIGRTFGSAYLDPAGGVDRAKLGALVFSNPAERSRLENLCHPPVRTWFQAWRCRASAAWAKFALIPLLFESGWESDWDWTVCLVSSPDIQADRLLERGLSVEDAQRRIHAQWPLPEKMKRADLVLSNNAGWAELSAEADRLKRLIVEEDTL